jgi:hypothetical protein
MWLLAKMNRKNICYFAEMDGHLLGDSGYKLSPQVLIPHPNPTSRAQEKYNRALAKTRVRVEMTFGIFKKR